MKSKFKQSKSSLFLMEMIITVLFFSIASAVCVQCFVKAHIISQETIELNNSVALATEYAEAMRGTDGSIDSILEVFPEAVKGDNSYFQLYYDADFNPCDIDNAIYVSDVTLEPNGPVQNMDIRIARLKDYYIIYELTATKYMNKPKG